MVVPAVARESNSNISHKKLKVPVLVKVLGLFLLF